MFIKNSIWKKNGERNVGRNVTLFTNKNSLESKMPMRKRQAEILKFDVLKTNILSGNKSKNIYKPFPHNSYQSPVSLSHSGTSGSVVLMLFTIISKMQLS